MIQRIKTDGVAMVVSKCPPRVDNVVATSNDISIVLWFDSKSLCTMYVRKDRIKSWDVARLQFLVSKELLKSACDVDLSGALRCKDTGMVRASEHPRYRKYFRMLRSLPMQAVAKSMRLAGFDERILESPDELVTLEDDEEVKKPECLDDALSRTAMSKASDVVLKTKVKLKLNGVLKTFRETIYSDGRVERVEITSDEE